jgi:L-arabinonolactonase
MSKKISDAGIFDGSTLDADGNLWWAIANGYKIIKINPNTKKVMETIDFPMYQLPCSAMFGGPKYKHMLITTIGQDVCGTQKMLGGQNGGVAILKFTDKTRGFKPGVFRERK